MTILRINIRILFRRIKAGKFSAFIKVVGIAVGLTALLLVFAFVKHETSYDKSFSGYERTFRVIRNWQEDKTYGVYTAVPFLKSFMERFPQIETGARLWPIGSESVVYKDKVFYNENIIAVDSSFIQTFDIELIEGNSEFALKNPGTVVISKKISEKYFPGGDAIGKTLILEGRVYDENISSYEITGIYDNFPETVHLQADFLLSLNSFSIANWPERRSHNLITYVKLKNSSDKENIEAQLPDFLRNFYGKEYYDFARSTYKLQPIKNIHLDTSVRYNSYESPKGSYSSLYIFPLLGILIFVVAIINYITLTIAENRRRRISLGINKLSGAGKWYLVKYFITESVFLTTLALLIANIFLSILAGPFERLVDRNIDFSFLYATPSIFAAISFILLLGIVNSIFPSLKFSSESAAQQLFDKNSTRKNAKAFQPVFQIIQLSICILLLSGSMMIYKQLSFINKEIAKSIEKENVVVIRNLRQLTTNRQAFKQELLKYPGIATVSECENAPGIDYYSHWGHPVDQALESVHIIACSGDHDYLKSLGIELIQGRYFDPKHPTDGEGIVLNETAIKRLGWEEPLGKRYALGSTYKVIGVLEDFHFEGLQNPIGPLGITLQSPNTGSMMLVKMNTENPVEVINKIKNTWGNFAPDREMQFSFLDSELAFWYKTERKTGTFALVLSLVAILLASMGLMAIVINTLQNYIKEIGVRKVNGAKVSQILVMLNTGFVKWIFLAFILACPIAWYAMTKWLENFAYKTEISWWIFALAGAIALAIALFTVSLQSWRAANRNPVEALRYE